MATSLNTNFIQVTFKTLSGGLNSTAGALNVADEESSDLQNIDFNKFGSVMKRSGYTVLNVNPLSGPSQALHWYQSLYSENAVTVNNGKIYKMDDLDGTWDDVSGAVSLGGTQDSYTKLLLNMDGAKDGVSFADSSPSARTVTNTETYDNYTYMLLHCDGLTGSVIFSDSSISQHTFTAYGLAKVDTSITKFGTGTASFDGASSYLATDTSTNLNLGIGDFTIETWFRTDDVSLIPGINESVCFQAGLITNTNYILFGLREPGTAAWFQYSSTSTGIDIRTGDLGLQNNTWYHMAVVRKGTTASDWMFFLNGVSKPFTINTGSATCTLPNAVGQFFIGAQINQTSGIVRTFLKGNLDEFRISKGLARWKTDFVPYKSAYGQVHIVTDYKQLGTSSGEFKEATYLSVPSSTDFSFSATDFTVDFWASFYTTTNTNIFLGQYEGANDYWYIKKETSSGANANKLSMKFVDGASAKGEYIMTTTWNALTNQFYHFAFIRSSTTASIYINGVSQALTATTAFTTNDVGMMAAPLILGKQNGTNYLDGFMDVARVSKGVVRWNSNFTPPVSSYGSLLDQDTETFLGYTLGCDQENIPWSWASQNSTASNITVPTNLTGAKYIKKFQNYCFLANVKLAGIRYPSRVYWSEFQNFNIWNDAEYIDISKDDGQEITGIKELGDRLVVYKNNSIYVIVFTGDVDIPFIVQRTNSAMGTVSHRSIQANENGHIFATYDGIAFFDGYNSYKVSDRINDTYSGINHDNMDSMVSLYQKEKNRYWLSCRSGTSLYNNFVITWDSYLNALSVYSGMSATSLCAFIVNGTKERAYFADSLGYYYQADTGLNDYPTNTKTAISSYFYTNWKSFDDVCDQKGVPNVYLTHRNESSTVLTFNYAYDFYNGTQYTQSFSATSTQSVTSLTTRQDLNGRGRFVRVGVSNNQTDSSFRIDGIGTYITREGKM
jgi:hypothetical protein